MNQQSANSAKPALKIANRAHSVASDRLPVVLGVLISAIVLAYFYVVDNFIFSTAEMAAIFKYLLMVSDASTAWLVLGVSIFAAFWRNPEPFIAIVEFIGRHQIAVAVAAAPILSATSVLVYHNHALSMDEYAAVFQAKIFASGHVYAQLPSSVIDWLIPPGFNGMFIVASRVSGRAIECYWPGFSMLLAPFELLGAPWMCNALLSALALILVYQITVHITHARRAGGWAILFAVCSGAFIASSISYYSMQAHLTANLLFAWLLLVPTPRRAFAAGVVGSLALVLHNPFPHALFAAPWIVMLLRSKNLRLSFVSLAVGYLPLLLLVGIGWLELRGFVTSGTSGLGAAGNAIGGNFSLPDRAILNSRVAALVKMWVWAVPCLFLFAVMGRIQHRDDINVRLMAQSAVLTFAGYMIVIFDQGHGWGYRYFQSAWGVIPILAACAFRAPSDANGRLAAFAGANALLGLVLIMPYQMSQIDGFISDQLAQLPEPRRPGNNVYFIGARGGFYSADLVQMDPLLRTQDLILFSRGIQMDADLRRQNWPSATLADRKFHVEEWHLGREEIRAPGANGSSAPAFRLSYSEGAAQPAP